MGFMDLFDDIKSNVPTTTPQQELEKIESGKLKKSKKPVSDKIFPVDTNDDIIGKPSQKQLVSNGTSEVKVITPTDIANIVDSKTMQQHVDDLQLNTINLQINEQKHKQEVEDKLQRAEKTVKKSGRRKKVVEEVVNQKVQEAAAKGQTITPQVRQQVAQQVAQDVKIDQITPDDYKIVKDVIEDVNNENLDNVNVPKLAAGIGEAKENIPDGDTVDLTDIEVKVLTKKTREGYFKTKVTIKKDGIPDIINQISSEVKKRTKGLISPRVCDLRVIGNTNKTQLRNSSLKLSVNTVVFKPDATRLKVNKGTRFMISIPENFNSTGNLLVYIQESRAKTCIEINTNELADVVDFFASNISDYYYQGYDVTLKKLQRKGVGCPIMEVVNLIVANRGYKIKTYGDNEDNHIYMVDLFSKDTETNEFIGVRIQEGNQPGLWDIIAFDRYYSNEYSLNQEGKTIKYLMSNILSILNKVYEMDWNQTLVKQEIDGLKNGTITGYQQQYVNDEDYIKNLITTQNEIKKLTHRKLWIAATTMLAMIDKSSDIYEPELNLSIKCLSKQVLKKISPNNYDAEAIVGETSACKFVLTYLAYPIKAGDKRSGREYITRQEYYQKYNVRDRRDYQNREKTVLRRQNQQRNYNARIYLFQLEYKLNGQDYKYVCKTFAELQEATKFLTTNPIGLNKIP